MPHAANPVGPFEPLPAVTYSGPYNITIPLAAANTDRLLVDVIAGPEHLVYRSAAITAGEVPTLANEGQLPGQLWISSANGTIYQVALAADAGLKEETLQEVVFAGPGRVLGFAFDRTGGLYLCNALQVRSMLIGCYARSAGQSVGLAVPTPIRQYMYINLCYRHTCNGQTKRRSGDARLKPGLANHDRGFVARSTGVLD